LASDTTIEKPEMAQPDSARIRPEFAVGSYETDADDPFFQWLRDGKSVRIDWSTFGIEKIDSKEARKIRSRHSLKCHASPRLFPSVRPGADGRF
jgi:hypothetical protein